MIRQTDMQLDRRTKALYNGQTKKTKKPDEFYF